MPVPALLWVVGGALMLGSGRGGGLAGTSTQLVEINGSPQVFAQRLLQIVSQVLPGLSLRARLLVVAHAAYESGWGSVGQHRDLTNNIFDLTAGSQWTGPVVMGTTPDGGVLQRWRSYADLESAMADYLIFLGYYDSAAAAELYGQADPGTFAVDLGSSNFYDTALVAPATYAQNLVSMTQTVARYTGNG